MSQLEQHAAVGVVGDGKVLPASVDTDGVIFTMGGLEPLDRVSQMHRHPNITAITR